MKTFKFSKESSSQMHILQCFNSLVKRQRDCVEENGLKFLGGILWAVMSIQRKTRRRF